MLDVYIIALFFAVVAGNIIIIIMLLATTANNSMIHQAYKNYSNELFLFYWWDENLDYSFNIIIIILLYIMMIKIVNIIT